MAELVDAPDLGPGRDPCESSSLSVRMPSRHRAGGAWRGLRSKRGPLAGVAQPVERLICNQSVGGSSPFTSSASTWRAACTFSALLWLLVHTVAGNQKSVC